MGTHTTERRRSVRRRLARPIKLRTAAGGRYLAGTTRDVSADGALFDLHHPQRLVAGQIVQLGIAWEPDQPLLAAATLRDARVVRSRGESSSQSVAVAFLAGQGDKVTR